MGEVSFELHGTEIEPIKENPAGKVKMRIVSTLQIDFKTKEFWCEKQ